MTFTDHAKIRMQQRCIPPVIVDWLLEFGSVKYTHGAEKYYFDKGSRKHLKKYVGNLTLKNFEDFMNVFVVIKDDCIVTTGYRTRRIKH